MKKDQNKGNPNSKHTSFPMIAMHTAILSVVCEHSKNWRKLYEFDLYIRIKNARMQSNEYTTNQLNSLLWLVDEQHWTFFSYFCLTHSVGHLEIQTRHIHKCVVYTTVNVTMNRACVHVCV